MGGQSNHSSFIRAGGRQESQSQRRQGDERSTGGREGAREEGSRRDGGRHRFEDATLLATKRARGHVPRNAAETGKVKGRDSPLEPPEATQPF